MKCVNKWTDLTLVLLFGIWHNIQITRAEAIPTSCLEQKLLDVVRKWRDLPTLEEINIPSYTGQYSGFGVRITFTAEDMKLFGVNNFTVEELTANGNDTLEASGTVRFPLLTIYTDKYNLTGRAYILYSLKGSGSMNITFRNVTVMFAVKLITDGVSPQINVTRLDFSVENAKINLEGSSWPINTVLNAESGRIINSYHSLIVESATRGATNVINNYLTTVTPEQITNFTADNCT